MVNVRIAAMVVFGDIWTKIRDAAIARRYLIQFAIYTTVVTICSAGILVGIQSTAANSLDRVRFLDAWFMAISCFSCTGLATVDYTRWRTEALVVLLITIELGNLVMCSAAPCMIRLYKLRKKRTMLNATPNYAGKDKHMNLLRQYTCVNKTILWSCILYVIICHVAGFLFLSVKRNTWWAFFHTVTGFNNAALVTNRKSFADPELAADDYTLFIFMFLMPMGNTLFPVWQRLLLTFFHRVVRSSVTLSHDPQLILFGMSSHEFEFGLHELLTHPRRYYTHLFSAKSTIYLVLMFGVLTLLDFFLFLPEFSTPIFPAHNHEVASSLFQSISTRTSGYAVVNMDLMKQGHLSYWIMAMYLSSFPFIITERTTRHTSDEDAVDAFAAHREQAENPTSLLQVGQDLRMIVNTLTNREDIRQQIIEIKKESEATIAQEIGWLWLAAIVISFYENHHLESIDPADGTSSFSRLLFEIASAFGTVGLSLSSPVFPHLSYSGSFDNDWSVFYIIVIMYFGKMRGLPGNIDVTDVDHLGAEDPTKAINPSPAVVVVTASPRGCADAEMAAVCPVSVESLTPPPPPHAVVQTAPPAPTPMPSWLRNKKTPMPEQSSREWNNTAEVQKTPEEYDNAPSPTGLLPQGTDSDRPMAEPPETLNALEDSPDRTTTRPTATTRPVTTLRPTARWSNVTRSTGLAGSLSVTTYDSVPIPTGVLPQVADSETSPSSN